MNTNAITDIYEQTLHSISPCLVEKPDAKNAKAWDKFACSEPEGFKIYFYLVSLGLSVPIMNALYPQPCVKTRIIRLFEKVNTAGKGLRKDKYEFNRITEYIAPSIDGESWTPYIFWSSQLPSENLTTFRLDHRFRKFTKMERYRWKEGEMPTKQIYIAPSGSKVLSVSLSYEAFEMEIKKQIKRMLKLTPRDSS